MFDTLKKCMCLHNSISSQQCYTSQRKKNSKNQQPKKSSKFKYNPSNSFFFFNRNKQKSASSLNKPTLLLRMLNKELAISPLISQVREPTAYLLLNILSGEQLEKKILWFCLALVSTSSIIQLKSLIKTFPERRLKPQCFHL